MGFNKVYRTLFNIEILHNYFLDEGLSEYGFPPAGPDYTAEEKKILKRIEGNLDRYQLSSFMRIEPTARTVQQLKNMRSTFSQTSKGFQVATCEGDNNEPFIPFPSDLKFDFIARITDQFFENYTDITIARSEPLYLSNVTPGDPPVPGEGEEITILPFKFCLLSKFKTDLTNGTPNPTAPMVKKEIELKDISPRELIDAFAVISIHLNGEGVEISLSNGGTEFNGTLPEVNWMFKNRSTTWKYHRSSDSVQVHASGGEIPLTKHGYVQIIDADTKEYPNPSARMIYNGESGYIDSDGDPVIEDVTKKYSRIFI